MLCDMRYVILTAISHGITTVGSHGCIIKPITAFNAKIMRLLSFYLRTKTF